MVGFPSGKLPNGQFAKGNKGGPGNPYSKHTNTLRAVMMRLLTEEKYEEICYMLIEKACDGDMDAIKEVHLRVFGKPTECPPAAEESQSAEPRRVVLVDYRQRPAAN